MAGPQAILSTTAYQGRSKYLDTKVGGSEATKSFQFCFWGIFLTDSHNIASDCSKSLILQAPHILTSKQSSDNYKDLLIQQSIRSSG